ncbi:MAG: ADP-dependent NAD(P)H-hydrate dehydratase, partial [Acidimicrobiaceae bacterium]|nr:ADP-dependent NAD(P)H-hydrate dehydratase [Acidimicrobiaceae bacterium]
VVTPAVLRERPVPMPDNGGGKQQRGTVLVIGGSTMTPGAVILAGLGALRAGAGKLQIATTASTAQAVAVAIPEALVAPLPETADGAIAPEAAGRVAERASAADAVLIGPGMMHADLAGRLTLRLLPLVEGPPVVIDGIALICLAEDAGPVRDHEAPVILTPNGGEAASILGVDEEKVHADPAGSVRRLSDDFGATAGVRQAETWITEPGGPLFCDQTGNIGLGTSGSGDVLAGVVAGFLARGADPLVAMLWGVHVHGAAGERLAARVGRIGFLARELLDEIPDVMTAIG